MPENSVKIILEAVDKTAGAFESLKGNATGALGSIQKSLSLIKFDAIVNLGRQAYQFGENMMSMARTTAAATMEIQKQSQTLGISADAYQKLAYAAKMSDVTTADLAIGLKILSRNMDEASQGTGTAKDYLDAMGIAVQESDGRLRPLLDIMGDIADKFQSWQDGPRKIAIALDLFGRSGEALIPLLNQGRSGMAAYGREAESLGVILSESIIKKGVETEDAFKRIDAQIIAIKADSGAAASEVLRLVENLAKWVNQQSLFTAEGAEKELKNLEAQVEYNLKLGSAYEKQIPALERIVKLQDQLGKNKAPDWVKDWVAGYTPAKKTEPPEKITPPEPGWIKKEIAQWDALGYSFEKLGTESQASLAKAALSADQYMNTIAAALDKGEVSATDFKNALGAATAAWQKLVPPDTTQQIAEVMIATDKAIREIGEDDPNRGARVQQLIDQEMKTIKAIEGPTIGEMKAAYNELKTQGMAIVQGLQGWIDQNPIRAGVDLKEFAKIDDAFKVVKDNIESTAIKIKVDASALTDLGGAGGGGLYESNMGLVTGAFSDQNFDVKLKFWGEASPTRPLSETIQEIIGQFGNLDNALSGLGAMINFSELSIQFQGLQRQLDQIGEIYHSYYMVNNAMPHVNLTSYGPWLDPQISRQLEQMRSDIMSQMGLTQLKMLMEMLQGFGGSYQSGGYIPKTGLYMLHKGEEVRPSNRVSMSSGPFIFNISSNDPKGAAREIEKVLKYGLSQGLRDAIKEIR